MAALVLTSRKWSCCDVVTEVGKVLESSTQAHDGGRYEVTRCAPPHVKMWRSST